MNSHGEPLVYLPDELPALLKCGRHTAQRIARQLGVRVGARKIVVPAEALRRLLAGEVEIVDEANRPPPS